MCKIIIIFCMIPRLADHKNYDSFPQIIIIILLQISTKRFIMTLNYESTLLNNHTQVARNLPCTACSFSISIITLIRHDMVV